MTYPVWAYSITVYYSRLLPEKSEFDSLCAYMTKELILSVTLKDCEVQTFRAGGPGGQNQNKRDTGVRIKHLPSGAVGESREHRSQYQNKRAAFIRMTETKAFKLWLRKTLGKEALIESRVEQDMSPKNLLIEGRSGGKWVPLDNAPHI